MHHFGSNASNYLLVSNSSPDKEQDYLLLLSDHYSEEQKEGGVNWRGAINGKNTVSSVDFT